MTPVQEVRAAKVGTGRTLALGLVCAAVSVACVVIPMFVIRPFRPQGVQELNFALAVRHAGPWLAGVCALAALVLAVLRWNAARIGSRIVLASLFVLATAGAEGVGVEEERDREGDDQDEGEDTAEDDQEGAAGECHRTSHGRAVSRRLVQMAMKDEGYRFS